MVRYTAGSPIMDNPEQPGIEQTHYLLENEEVFSRSQLWEMQRTYYESMGVEAWRQGEVPHYVTSNPKMADSYAEIVFAFYRDRQHLAPDDEPLTICELGAGSGRFAYHFLRRLSSLCALGHVPLESFRYVLTDLAPSNLAFWRAHPRFQPYFDAGVLDCALFDLTKSKALALERSGETIAVGTLRRPLVAIANYVFDTIPQDLFYVNEGQCEECVISLFVNKEHPVASVAELLTGLEYRLARRDFVKPPYREVYLKRLVAEYQRTLEDTFLLFPATGLRALHRLQALSRQGVMLLSADKGDHRLSALQGKAAPGLTLHGSFSLSVNYHAFKTMCEQSGGVALFPTMHHRSLNVSCLLMIPDAADHFTTISAYQRNVEEFGPDAFYSLTKHARQHAATMSVEDILAYLRFSHYDGHQFAVYVPRLTELASTLTANEREDVIAAIEKVWEMHYPLGEEHDLADQIAHFLYEIDDFAGAITFFERSIAMYGEHEGTRNNLAVCRRLLNDCTSTDQTVTSAQS
ncbi:MAG: tetratricopeptide repeat protein [Thermomicrobia bacterium]|nr:tetratricopeptide repeat protein [Thermomicrobia bacterium]